MSDEIYLLKEPVTVVVVGYEKKSYGKEKFFESLRSIIAQKYISVSKILIVDIAEKKHKDSKELPQDILDNPIPKAQISFPGFSIAMKEIIKQSQENGYMVLVDIRESPVYLKSCALVSMIFSLQKDKRAGMLYSDYGIITKDGVQERHLLEYHEGRLRDNLDLGKVYAFPMHVLKSIESDESFKHAAFYDLRLKISEKYNLKHIANRTDGYLYEIETPAKAHNVFDYLQDAKEAQKEMEVVLTNHLKRIHGYLEPDDYEGKIASQDHESDILVSILIPVYRRPEFIATAIESAIHQTLGKKVEVIVIVNGGDHDPTSRIVRKYLPGGSLYSQEASNVHLIVVDINNIGLCLNLGLKKAKGKYYLQLDSDDRLKPFAAEEVVKVFEQNPQAGMVIGSYEVWEKQNDGTLVRREDIPVVKHEEWTRENGRNNLLRINGAGAPRAYNIKVVENMGFFSMNDDPHARNYGEDYDMVLRISEKYPIERIWDPIYEVVRHAGGTDHSIDQYTVDRNDNAKDRMRLIALERRKNHNLGKMKE